MHYAGAWKPCMVEIAWWRLHGELTAVWLNDTIFLRINGKPIQRVIDVNWN